MRARSTTLALASAVLAACGGGGASSPATQPSGSAAGDTTPAETLTFAWPAGAVVAVTERVEKQKVLTLTYELHVCADESGLRIRHRNFALTAMEGVDLGSEEVKKSLAEVQPLLEMVPDMIVGNDGEIVAIDGIPALIEELARRFPQMAPRMRQLGADPNAVAQLEQLAGDIWRGWVSHWLRFDPAGGDRQEVGDVTFERLKTEPGRLTLRATKRWDPEALRAAVAKALPEADRGLVAGAKVERTDVIEVTTDPATLRPSHARRTQERVVELAGKPPIHRREVNDYELDWESRASTTAVCP
jgi:hypothetical protein